MSLLDPLNNYCERLGPGLWNEPLNVVSNLAFFIAAWVLWRMLRTSPSPLEGEGRGGGQFHAPNLPQAPHPNPPPQGGREITLLILLLVLVGTGSTLFHIFANKLTLLGDVIPIAAFTFTYLWIALRRVVKLSKPWAALALLAFAGAHMLTPYVPYGWRTNDSVDYFPCLGALFLMALASFKRNRPAAMAIFRAACWFTVSIIYRSIDIKLCPVLPIGTHFIWHIINGWVLFLLVRAVMANNTILRSAQERVKCQ